MDLIEVPTQPGDRFLLCSDGLTGMVTDEEISDSFAAPSLEKTVRTLVDTANDRGGVDNITAILIEVQGEKGEDSKSKKTSVKKLPRVSGESTAVTIETAPASPDPPKKPKA